MMEDEIRSRPHSLGKNRVGLKGYDNQAAEVVDMQELNEQGRHRVVEHEYEEKEEKRREVSDDDDDDDSDSDDEIDLKRADVFTKFKYKTRLGIINLSKNPIARWAFAIILTSLYIIYVGVAIILNQPFNIPSDLNSTTILTEYVFSNNPALALFVLSVIAFLFIFWDNFGSKLAEKYFKFKVHRFIKKFGSWILVTLVAVGYGVYLGFTITDSYSLVSLSGLVAFVLVCVAISTNPSKINWHVLVVGLEIQIFLGIILLRTEFGYLLFQFVSEQVTIFLGYTDRGSFLVFGEKFTDHRFAFQSIPVIVFFGSIINLFYYMGFIQYIILKLAWFVNLLMGTSPTESMNATANIFLGQTEAPLLIKPFLEKMTKSEIFSVMTGGFATVAGSVLATYIGFQIPANHLIIASLMAAPGALAVSKTICPETKKTKANWDAIKNLPKGDAKNAFEAISIGASNTVGAVAGIISNLIAFTAIFAFVDAIFIWLFGMIGLENFGITSIMQYLFYPFALFMGVAIEDCQTISKLIGIKMFVNEFVAYNELGNTIRFRQNATLAGIDLELYKNGTLSLPTGLYMIWNERSVLIATYALCGFANFASIGIQIGGLSALAPGKMKVFTKFAARAMLAGNITNFITACIAGKSGSN